tara:strand:- start:843 stop:1082 length:240 start_codon:yes stop_codon:yes gene_type:complete
MPKKSYMNTKNILSEGFFDKVLKLFGADLEKQLKKDKEFKTNLKDLNKSVKKFEKNFSKSYGGRGGKLKLRKFNLLDFL